MPRHEVTSLNQGQALDTRTVLTLQGRAGNRAVATLVERSATPPSPLPQPVQRCNGGQCDSNACAEHTDQQTGPLGIPEQPVVQRANAADIRLPRDQAEALAYAAQSGTDINAANARLASAPERARGNVPLMIAHLGLRVEPLTPRHDSPVGRPTINFFASVGGYGTSIVLAQTVSHQIDSGRTAVRVRARDHVNIDNPLPGPEVENRLVQGVSEVAHTAALPGAPSAFELYRAQFNSMWNTSAFAGLSTAFEPTLDSRGPRNPRARAIFQRIYTEASTTLKMAYDLNVGDLRTRIDTYSGPEGLNLLNSPRIQGLAAVFSSASAPVPAAQYPAFKTAVQNAAIVLDPDDRQAIQTSNDWEKLINRYLTIDAQRQEIRVVIATTTVPAPAPTSPPAPGPSGPATGGSATQQFINGIRIDGPTAPVPANQREETVPVTPRSTTPNPGVSVDTRFTVTPAARLRGANTSPTTPWPAGAPSGVSFSPVITNTGTVTMNAHLDLLNLTSGVARTTPLSDLTFTVQDNRQANFIASWFAAVSFNNGSGQDWFSPGKTVRYRGGTQNFAVGAFLPAGSTNPGLNLFVRARIKRGATVVFPAPPLAQFPPDQARIPTFSMPLTAPAVIPAGGDPLAFEVELLGADRSTVLSTKTVAITVLPEATYTQSAAHTAAAADNAHFHDTSATGLLGIMTARGSVAANVAAAITAGRITLRPLTVRHDSAAYVTAKTGAPNPAMVGYFIGTNYTLPASDPNSFAGVAGAAAFSIGGASGNIVINRTTDVVASTRRPNDEIIMLAVHEAVHALDIRPGAGTDIERYKTEFRAYWMDGRYGPPERGTCTPGDGPQCRNTAMNPSMTPPGPKSPRARAIFDGLYGSVTYPFVKPAYDNNTGGFRDEIDNYLVPDGINLIVSLRLEELRRIIAAGVGLFPSFRNKVKAFMGIGPPPAAPGGVLTSDERGAIARSRAWRALVESSVSNAAQRRLIKTDLGIPL